MARSYTVENLRCSSHENFFPVQSKKRNDDDNNNTDNNDEWK